MQDEIEQEWGPGSYIADFELEIPDLYYSHRRSLRARLSGILGGRPMFGRASLED